MEQRLRRVIFTCGGTAGHVNPAIALAQLMHKKDRVLICRSGTGTGEGPDSQGGVCVPHRPYLQFSPVLSARRNSA